MLLNIFSNKMYKGVLVCAISAPLIMSAHASQETFDLSKTDFAECNLKNVLSVPVLLIGGSFLTYKQVMRLSGNLPDSSNEFLRLGPVATKIVASGLLVTGIAAIICGAVQLRYMTKKYLKA